MPLARVFRQAVGSCSTSVVGDGRYRLPLANLDPQQRDLPDRVDAIRDVLSPVSLVAVTDSGVRVEQRSGSSRPDHEPGGC
jgi:hypothetical protein